MIYTFGDCELDTGRLELRCNGVPRHVEPQVFDVLRHLVEQRQRLVTKEELLDGIWGHRFVTPATLNSRIKAARQAVGDDGAAQHIIRTIRGRGFRFVAEVRVRDAGDASAPSTVVRVGVPAAPALSETKPTGSRASTPDIVGRTAELHRLEELLHEACAGTRRCAFVSGQSGIGKSALVDAFAAAAADGRIRVARGQCLETRGPGEPYLPILDAFGRLGREPGGEAVIDRLEACAPTWLAQMPSLLGPERLESARRGAFGATRDRMLREMADALELLTRDLPLLLVLEDLHWSDPSTLELLAWITPRTEPARLMVLATYRPGDAESDLTRLLTSVRRGPQFTEIALRPWGGDELREYVGRRLAEPHVPEPLTALLRARAEGNPLFVQTLLDHWVETGALERAMRAGFDDAAVAALAADVPDTVRMLIEQRVDRFSPEDQELLEAASVAGMEFEAALIAAAVDLDMEKVERRCAVIARRGDVILAAGSEDWPDGTVSGRFRFAHHLFREVLYHRVPHARRARLHRVIGLRLETALGDRVAEQAGQLALHFRSGRDDARLLRYLELAARQASERNAHREAIDHLNSALEHLERRPDLPDALAAELRLQRMLGPALLVTRGWGDPAAERAYARARQLSEQLGDQAQLASVLYGLAYLHEIRGDYHRSEALLQERLGIAVHEPEPALMLESHELLSCSRFHQGNFGPALETARRALQFVDAAVHDPFIASLADNAAVGCYYWAADALWFLGYPDQALAPIREGLALAERAQLIYMRAASEWHMARLRMLRREPTLAAEHAECARAIAERQGYPYPHALTLVLSGRLQVEEGATAEGLELIRTGLAMQAAMGADMERPYCLGLLAEALLGVGRTADCIAAADEALDIISRRARAFFWESELHRIRGEALTQGEMDGADAEFRTALEIARRQQARALELRAAMSRLRLAQRSGGDSAAAHNALARLYAGFTEGFDTADLQEAHALLEPVIED